MNNWLISQAISWGLGRLVEPSTWAGLAASLAASLHFIPNDDFTRAFVGAGVAISALLSVSLKEGFKKNG
jgi:outer membrane protein W